MLTVCLLLMLVLCTSREDAVRLRLHEGNARYLDARHGVELAETVTMTESTSSTFLCDTYLLYSTVRAPQWSRMNEAFALNPESARAALSRVLLSKPHPCASIWHQQIPKHEGSSVNRRYRASITRSRHRGTGPDRACSACTSNGGHAGCNLWMKAAR